MDSWDVGQGALDDGGGMAAVWQAMNAIRQLAKDYADFVPKRFILDNNFEIQIFEKIKIINQ